MSNSRRLRRALGNYGHVKQATRDTISTCPHCASPVQLLDDEREWDRVRLAHGVRVGPLVMPAGGVVHGWWFCHHCADGGAIIGIPPLQTAV